MTQDEWVEAALAARVAQGLPEGIEDDRVLDLIADAFARAAPNAAPPPTAVEDDDHNSPTEAQRRRRAAARAS